MNISDDDIEPEEIIPNKESDLGEYTKRNYDAIDDQLEQVAKREKVVTNRLRLANLKRLLIMCGLGIILLAIAVLIIFFGIRLLIYGPPEEVYPEIEIPSEVRLIIDERKPYEEQLLKIQEKSGEVVTNYNIFKERSAIDLGFLSVVTGWKFPNPESNPTDQWCYVNYFPKEGVDINQTLDLAKITNRQFNNFVNPELAENNQIPLDTLEALYARCEWYRE